jgi:hypothetical protein
LNTHLPDALWLMWRHFDAGFYVDIAEHGYWAASTLQTKTDWIYLPLYVMSLFAALQAVFMIFFVLALPLIA